DGVALGGPSTENLLHGHPGLDIFIISRCNGTDKEVVGIRPACDTDVYLCTDGAVTVMEPFDFLLRAIQPRSKVNRLHGHLVVIVRIIVKCICTYGKACFGIRERPVYSCF